MGAATAAPQHMQALAQANRTRLARCELKRQVAEGERTVVQVLLVVPWEANTMTIAELLMAQRGWGRTRCSRLLALASVSPAKLVGSMTERQRHVVCGRLTGFYDDWERR